MSTFRATNQCIMDEGTRKIDTCCSRIILVIVVSLLCSKSTT